MSLKIEEQKKISNYELKYQNSKMEAFKEIYAKNRNLEKEKREIKLKFRRKIDKK